MSLHFHTNPLIPKEDTPYDTIIYKDMYGAFQKYLNDNNISLCPEGFELTTLSLSEDRQRIVSFMNMFYGTDKWFSIITADDLQAMEDRGNVYVVAITWRTMLIGMITVEQFNVYYKGETHIMGYGDNFVVHPKFRRKGISNAIIGIAMDKAGQLGCELFMFTTHLKLDINTTLKRPLYTLALSNVPMMTNIHRRSAYKPRYPRGNQFIAPTIDHVKRFNEIRYQIQLLHDDKMLQSMLKHDMIYTNGDTILRFISMINCQQGIQVKTALLTDYINVNNVRFFEDVIVDLTSKGFDLITVINDNTMNNIIHGFPFDKNSDMQLYTGNIRTKAKPNEIHVVVR